MSSAIQAYVRRIVYSAATAHAPRGGASIGGKRFTGGEFVPGKDLRRATPDERSKLKIVGDKDRTKPTAPVAKEKPRASSGEMVAARRVGVGKEAKLVMADGSPAPAHIKPSMVPPDWSDVQISASPDADVLVKARDKAGRIKTVYSDNFTMKTAAMKFARIHEMMSKAGEITGQIHRDRHSPNEATRDAAELTWLIEQQATRPGSDTDTKAKVKAYGATTLRAEHVVESPEGVRLQFIGKEGVSHNHLVRDPELAKVLLQRKATAGKRDGKLFATDEKKLNAYIRTLDGGKFTAKDFRTLKATRLAVEHIKQIGDCCKDMKSYKASVKAVAEHVSSVLGNKPQQALVSYINPAVFSVWRNPGG